MGRLDAVGHLTINKTGLQTSSASHRFGEQSINKR